MADEAPAKKKSGWFKAIFGTIMGLCSGAAVMYITPLVNKAIAPQKPVANFKYENNGLTVRFQNLSTGFQGYWDFGDGSALEPVSSDNQFVNHTYSRAGEYTVKLSLQNLLNDTNERSVPVKIECPTPQVAKLDVKPLSQGNMAPAAFRFEADVKDAEVCVWDFGDGRPFEIVEESPRSHYKRVTFTQPGHYVVKIAAINGANHGEKTAEINVVAAPQGQLTAVLSVTDAGMKIDERTKTMHFGATFPPNQRDDVYPFTAANAARPGWTISDLHIPLPNGQWLQMGNKTEMDLDATALGIKAARKLHLSIASDRETVKLTGELVRSDKSAPPSLVLGDVELIVQRQTAATHPVLQVTAPLAVFPGAGTTAELNIPAPPTDMTATQRQLRLEIRDGPTTVWQTSQLPVMNAAVVTGGRRYVLNAAQIGEKITVQLTDTAGTSTGLLPTGN